MACAYCQRYCQRWSACAYCQRWSACAYCQRWSAHTVRLPGRLTVSAPPVQPPPNTLLCSLVSCVAAPKNLAWAGAVLHRGAAELALRKDHRPVRVGRGGRRGGGGGGGGGGRRGAGGQSGCVPWCLQSAWRQSAWRSGRGDTAPYASACCAESMACRVPACRTPGGASTVQAPHCTRYLSHRISVSGFGAARQEKCFSPRRIPRDLEMSKIYVSV